MLFPQAALTAVYGKDDELQVFIDHHRLQSILTAAQANDPSGKGAALVRLQRGKEKGDVFFLPWIMQFFVLTCVARHYFYSHMDAAGGGRP